MVCRQWKVLQRNAGVLHHGFGIGAEGEDPLASGDFSLTGGLVVGGEVVGSELQFDRLGLARIEQRGLVKGLQFAEFAVRSSGVELDDLLAGCLAGVGDGAADLDAGQCGVVLRLPGLLRILA